MGSALLSLSAACCSAAPTLVGSALAMLAVMRMDVPLPSFSPEMVSAVCRAPRARPSALQALVPPPPYANASGRASAVSVPVCMHGGSRCVQRHWHMHHLGKSSAWPALPLHGIKHSCASLAPLTAARPVGSTRARGHMPGRCNFASVCGEVRWERGARGGARVHEDHRAGDQRHGAVQQPAGAPVGDVRAQQRQLPDRLHDREAERQQLLVQLKLRAALRARACSPALRMLLVTAWPPLISARVTET